MAEEVFESTIHASFDKLSELSAIQNTLLSLDLYEEPSNEDDTKEVILLQQLSIIFGKYQEQAYLLDPSLESLVTPVVDKIKTFAREHHDDKRSNLCSRRLERLTMVLYCYIKSRGRKTITRFFPHEITDMPIALNFMMMKDKIIEDPQFWALRYTMMLWLSLIVMIPFDLAQFDEEGKTGQTARSLETVGKAYLGKAGLEREGAALLLSRLFMRKDMKSAFPAFVGEFTEQLQSIDVITAIGHLQVLNEVIKTGSQDQIHDLVKHYMDLAEAVNNVPTLSGNTLSRKMKTKFISRIAMRMLPAPKSRTRSRALSGSSISYEDTDDDFEVPESVENLLEQLFDSLQDKDTIVRWSTAKGIARIAERLPQDYSSQILETLMGLYAIHSTTAASLYDLPAIAESTWHGATLACAEMARRNLVTLEQLPTLIEWVSKALYFDLRKGSHSIGSNVRDAAAYVLWSLARTQDVEALKPVSWDLARKLVTVSLFDREIHIRRAASAAFQEHVGRTSLFPHGIDVLGKTDFYAISGQRHAFLVAAPQVAEHNEYRLELINHLLGVVLRHWDPAMRELGSKSLRAICELDLLELGPSSAKKAVHILSSYDIADIQGALLALSEISLAYRLRISDPDLQDKLLQENFSYLVNVSRDVLIGPRNGIVTAAACQLIGNSITLAELNVKDNTSVPIWRIVIDHGLHHKTDSVQEAAANAYATITRREDLSEDIRSLIEELGSSMPAVQENLPRLLGLIDYNTCQSILNTALAYLLKNAMKGSKVTVELRRNCYHALPKILYNLLPDLVNMLSPSMAQSILDTLISGLDDYTIDERGDVGSWVRMACVKGLKSFIEDILSLTDVDLEAYLPLTKYHCALAGILKQGVERLDNVRYAAGTCFLRIMDLPIVATPGSTWSLPGLELLQELFAKENLGLFRFPWLASSGPSNEVIDWSDGVWLFPRAVRLLDIVEYRQAVLKGFILSLSSKTDSTQRPASTSLAAYAKSLPVYTDSGYGLVDLITDILQPAKTNLTSNGIVIPILQTLTLLLEANAFRSLADHPRGVESLSSILDLSTKNVTRLKNIQRIHETMKITINLMTFIAVSSKAIGHLSTFLTHSYPRIRADTAEYLYLLLQSTDTFEVDEEAEEILLETEWSSEDINVAKRASEQVIGLLLASVA